MSNQGEFTHYAYNVQSMPVTTTDDDQYDIYMPRLDQITVPIMTPKTTTNGVTKYKRERNTAGAKKRVRTEFTPSQLIALNKEFTADIYISKVRKIELASELHLTEHQVKLWFQNRRAAMKKRSSRTIQQSNGRIIQQSNGRMTQQTSTCDSESTNSSNNDGKHNVDAYDHNYLANGFNCNSSGPSFNSNFDGDLDNSFNKFYDTYLGTNFDSSFSNNLDSHGNYPANSSSNCLYYNDQPEQATVNKLCNDSYPMNQNVDNLYGVGPLSSAENQGTQPSVDTFFNFGNDLFDLW